MSRSLVVIDVMAATCVALSEAARVSAGLPAPDARLTALAMAWYSMAVGMAWATSTPTAASTASTNIRPKKEMPACRALELRFMSYPPLRLWILSFERADAFEVAEIHPDEERPAD